MDEAKVLLMSLVSVMAAEVVVVSIHVLRVRTQVILAKSIDNYLRLLSRSTSYLYSLSLAVQLCPPLLALEAIDV